MPYREHASKALSQLYDKSNSYAESHSGRGRGVAAGTAATFLDMGLDKINRRNGTTKSVKIEQDPGPVDEFPPEFDDQDYSPRGSFSSEFGQGTHSEDTKSHFVDKFLDRWLKHAIPENSPDRQVLENRLKDPARKKKASLSIRVISSNFKNIASRMGTFFELQYGLLHIITWKKPSKTLTALVFYTATCLWPHLVLAYPLIFLLFGIIVPGYLHRHPMRTPELITVKRRGQSFLSFFSGGGESSIVEDLLDEHEDRTDTELRPQTSNSDTSSVISDDSSTPADSEKDKTKVVKSQMALLMNMRDLQNLTTDLLNGFDEAERFCYETAGFKDERLSTVIFYGVIVATYVILFLGQFIPWRLIFIQSGWVGMILCHPGSKKFLVELSKKRQERADRISGPEEEAIPVNENKKKFDSFEIIVDESPEVRIVEVYELEMKSVLDTHWSFYRYTTSIFDSKNPTRLANKFPPGVDQLSKVHPVKDWKFDLGFANKWQIDKDPAHFIKSRSFDQTKKLRVPDDENDGWIYDIVDSFDEEFAVEFRRRRLFRECYRYARPVRTIKKA